MSCVAVVSTSVLTQRVGCDVAPVVTTQGGVAGVAEQVPAPLQVVAFGGFVGAPGASTELRTSATHVQWRLVGAPAWTDLIALSALTGPPGAVPEAPVNGAAYARQDATWVAALPATARGAADGVASLVSGKVPEAQLPAVVISDVFTVGSQSAMLALTAERGDIAVRTDINRSFALAAEPAATLANWIELRTPTDAVLSVAGKTGAVTLAKGDVGLSNVDNTSDSGKPVSTAQQTALDGKVAMIGAQTVAGVKTFSSRSSHAGAYTPATQPAHSATPTFDCAASNVFEPAELTGNVTAITLSSAAAGQTVQLRFVQDATGGRTVAVPAGAKVDGSINTAANRVSWLILTYSARGARWEGNWLQVPA